MNNYIVIQCVSPNFEKMVQFGTYKLVFVLIHVSSYTMNKTKGL